MADATGEQDPQLTALIASVRRRCKPGLWSQGVTLARAGAVTVESTSPEEIVLRVRAPGRVVAPTAVLYPTENEIGVRLPGAGEPVRARRGGGDCAVGAGGRKRAGARRRCARAGRGRRPGGGAGRLPVRRAADGGLRLARVLVEADGSEDGAGGALASRLADPAQAARLQVEEVDLRRIGCWRPAAARANRGVLLPTKLDGLMRILAGAALWLDGVGIAISEEELRPVHVSDWRPNAAGPLTLTLSLRTLTGSPPRPAGAVGVRGAASSDDRRRPARAGGGGAGAGAVRGRRARGAAPPGETELAGALAAEPPAAAGVFAAAEIGELVTVVLPDLGAARRRSTCRATGCPGRRAISPRVSCWSWIRSTAGLSVLPTLVYGAPPVARIDAGKLVYLRGPVPLRDVPAEQRVVERLRGELDLSARPAHHVRRRGRAPLRREAEALARRSRGATRPVS